MKNLGFHWKTKGFEEKGFLTAKTHCDAIKSNSHEEAPNRKRMRKTPPSHHQQQGAFTVVYFFGKKLVEKGDLKVATSSILPSKKV